MSTSEDNDKAGTGTGADDAASTTSSSTPAAKGKAKAANTVGASKAGASKVGSSAKAASDKAASDKAADDIAKGKEPKTRRGDRPEKVPGGPSSTLFKVVMLGLMVVGLVWIVIFYLFNGDAPIPGIRYGNLAIGFGLIMAGFVMTTRWR